MWGERNCLSFEMAVGGIEPPSPRLTVLCSTARPPLPTFDHPNQSSHKELHFLFSIHQDTANRRAVSLIVSVCGNLRAHMTSKRFCEALALAVTTTVLLYHRSLGICTFARKHTQSRTHAHRDLYPQSCMK